jgi:hypothetical protein
MYKGQRNRKTHEIAVSLKRFRGPGGEAIPVPNTNHQELDKTMIQTDALDDEDGE